MSEQILKAILQLLAIVAKEDDLTTDEIAIVENFLADQLSEEEAQTYFNMFLSWAKEPHDASEESARIDGICEQINSEQTAQQKIVVILNLIVLIAADGIVSKREKSILYQISDNINVPQSVTDLIKAFVIYQERNKIISENILVIDEGKNAVPEKCKHLEFPYFEGFVFILRIPNQEVYFAKYVGENDLMLNGSAMRSQRIYNFSSGSVIKTANSAPIYHSEVINIFRQISSEHHLTFTANDVSFKFKNGKIGLQKINIQEESGSLIALMGGSGAGKSTLLNVLNGNETPSEGSVRINGVDIHVSKHKIEGVIGYVPQDDLLIEELSVFDNLYYAAKLSFKDASNDELTKLVDTTLESLGLYETRRLKVGSPLEKTISGGQRKRLNIGLELLREPSVLFVDEPTSGLSSRDSENIMDLLKSLSLKGKMVFVVIHQPSEDIFKMFDKLLILDVGGFQVYYGNPVGAVSYFKDIAKIVDHSNSVNPEQVFNIIEAKVVNEYGNFTNKRKVSPKQWYKYFLERIEIQKIKETDVVPHKTLHIPNKLKQLSIFTIRDIKSKLSNKQYLFINLLEAPFLALILSFIIKYSSEDLGTYQFRENINIPVFFFMSVIVALFMGLTVSAEEIIKDRKILKRESFLNLSRLSYLNSKLVILFSLSAIQTITYIIISHAILEIKGMHLSAWLVLFSISCFANVLGLNVSSAFKSAVTVYILIPLLVIPQLILSGVVVNFDKINPLITAKDKVPMIGEVMASRWAFEALSVTQFKDNAFESTFYPYDKVMADSEFKTAYLLPQLESDLDFIHLKIKDANQTQVLEINSKLKTIKNEFGKQLDLIGYDKFPEYEQLTFESFNNNTFEKSIEFIAKLKTFFNLKFKKANDEKQARLKAYNSSQDMRLEFLKMRSQYENEANSQLVKNILTQKRIIEHQNELIQKIYPIYLSPSYPNHPFDFRAQFYQPEKHFGGLYFDTLYFNVTVIWCMTILLFIALYFELLKKLMNIFGQA
ncbi:MAG: ATP-binding cassette domain-containing protein [Cyclobacteriaceae bacterium]